MWLFVMVKSIAGAAIFFQDWGLLKWRIKVLHIPLSYQRSGFQEEQNFQIKLLVSELEHIMLLPWVKMVRLTLGVKEIKVSQELINYKLKYFSYIQLQSKPTKIICNQFIIDACCGDSHTLVLLKDGRLKSCGSNSNGCLGHSIHAINDKKKRCKQL